MRLSNCDRRHMKSAILAITDAARVCEDRAVIARMGDDGMSEKHFTQFIGATRDRHELAVREILLAIGRCDEAAVIASSMFVRVIALGVGSFDEVHRLIDDAIRRCEEMPSAIDHLADVVDA